MAMRIQQKGIREQLTKPGEFRRSNIDAPIEAFGGGKAVDPIVKGVQSIARTMSEIEEKERKRANEIRLLEADRKAAIAQSKASSQITETQGKNAFNLDETVVPAYEESLKAIESELTPEQQLMFRSKAQSRFLSINSQADKKMSLEVMKYTDNSVKELVSTEQDLALQNFDDEEALATNVKTQVDAIELYAGQMGWGVDQKRNAILDAKSTTYKSVIQKIADGGADLEAKKYFEKYKGDMSGKDVAYLEKVLNESSLVGESQRIADQIMVKYGDDATAALNAARVSGDGEIRDHVVRRVKTQISENKMALKESRDQNFNELSSAVYAGSSFEELPASQRAILTTAQKNELRKQEQQRRNNFAYESDSTFLYSLSLEATTPETRSKFLRRNLGEVRSKLSESDFKSMMKMQQQMRKGESSDLYDGIQTKMQIVNNTLRQLDITTGSKAKEDDLKRASQFNSEVDRLVIQQQKELGRKLTNQEVRKVVNDLATDVVTDDYFRVFGLPIFKSNQETPYFELKPGDRAAMTVEEIPESERRFIMSKLRSMRNPPALTNENILRAHRAMIRAQNGR